MKKRIEQMANQMLRVHYKVTYEEAERESLGILQKIPVELLTNIDEWCLGKPLTDVYIGLYSVPMLLDMDAQCDFLEAVNLLTIYKENPDVAERLIWNIRR